MSEYKIFGDNADIDNIVASIQQFDRNTLEDTLAYLLKTYVIDNGVQFNGVIHEGEINNSANEMKAQSTASVDTFAALITDLKNKKSFPELELFTVENGKVYIELDGSKKLIIANKANIKNNKDQQKTEVKNVAENSDTQKSMPGRFGNLEMDG